RCARRTWLKTPPPIPLFPLHLFRIRRPPPCPGLPASLPTQATPPSPLAGLPPPIPAAQGLGATTSSARMTMATHGSPSIPSPRPPPPTRLPRQVTSTESRLWTAPATLRPFPPIHPR